MHLSDRGGGVHGALLLCLVLFVARVAAAGAVIPPWHNPDEPSHFGYVWVLAEGGGFRAEPDEAAAIERRVLQSMADARWWAQYGKATPEPIPTEFIQESEHITPIGGGAQPIYYVSAASYLKVLGLSGLSDQFWALRLLSAAMALLTLIVIWVTTRSLFGDEAALATAAITALHPQFLIVALTVGPDALVNLLAAVIWWQSARLLRGARLVPAAAAISSCGILLVFTKRLGAPVAAAGLLILLFFTVLRAGTPGRRVAAVIAVCTGVGAVVLALAVAVPDVIATMQYSWGLFLRLPSSWDPKAADPSYFAAYTREVLDSAWLVAGYLRYPLPAAWLTFAYIVTGVAAAGALTAAVREGGLTRRGVLLSGWFAGVQVLALYLTTYTSGYTAQGRYLFPSAGACAALACIGIRQWPFVGTRHSYIALVASICAIDVAGWLSVLIPAYDY